MKKSVLIIVSCLFFSIAIVVVLFAVSDISPTTRENFYRVFRDDVLGESTSIDCKYNSYYIAGAMDNRIYLANFTSPLHLLSAAPSLSDTQHLRLKIKNMDSLKYRSIRLKIDSPYFFLMDGNIPYLIRGNVNNWYGDQFLYDSAYFTSAVPISSSSFVIRSLSAESLEYVLGKIDSRMMFVNLHPGLLQKQIDGSFCVDGTLLFNKELKKAIYVYYYRNQYIVMDSSLNLNYRANTIDTNRLAKIKVDSIRSKKARAKSGPATMVNRAISTYGNWLFVNSRRLGMKENALLFKESSVIDVYNLEDRSYHYSFYIPDYKGKKMTTFQVFRDCIVAIHDHYLVRYKLNLNRNIL